jgi:hypothetical protein
MVARRVGAAADGAGVRQTLGFRSPQSLDAHRFGGQSEKVGRYVHQDARQVVSDAAMRQLVGDGHLELRGAQRLAGARADEQARPQDAGEGDAIEHREVDERDAV